MSCQGTKRIKYSWRCVNRTLRRASTSPPCLLQVFVAAGEADSVAATWILRKMFQTDGVMHTIVPVTGYDHLQQSWQVCFLHAFSSPRGNPHLGLSASA